jgi:AraC family transcriptional regulator, positive regulator of tynA and feaB
MREFFSTKQNNGRSAGVNWSQIVRGAHRGLQVDRLVDNFDGQMLKWTIGSSVLTWPRASGAVLERWQVDADPAHPTIVMHLQHRGSNELYHRGKSLHLMAGDVAFCAGNEYSRVESSDKHEVLVVEIGLDCIRHLVPDVDLRLAVRFPADLPFVRVLHSTLLSLWRESDAQISNLGQSSLVDSLCSLMAVAMTEEKNKPSKNIICIKSKFLSIVSSKFEDPDLKIDDIASELGITPRSIQLAIAKIGSTPLKLLNDYRLDRAFDLLQYDKDRSITEIAFDVGFNDSGYFSRCFQRKYGVSPRLARARKWRRNRPTHEKDWVLWRKRDRPTLAIARQHPKKRRYLTFIKYASNVPGRNTDISGARGRDKLEASR